MWEGDGDVGEDGGGVGEDRGDDDGPRRHSGATGSKGKSPPSSSYSLTFSLDGRRVSPLVLGSHGVGGERDPPRLDLSLCFCVLEFCSGTVSFISRDPSLRLDWNLCPDHFPKLSFLAAKEGH